MQRPRKVFLPKLKTRVSERAPQLSDVVLSVSRVDCGLSICLFRCLSEFSVLYSAETYAMS